MKAAVKMWKLKRHGSTSMRLVVLASCDARESFQSQQRRRWEAVDGVVFGGRKRSEVMFVHISKRHGPENRMDVSKSKTCLNVQPRFSFSLFS